VELNITAFFNTIAPMDYSASVAEIGNDAGPATWRAAFSAASMGKSISISGADAMSYEKIISGVRTQYRAAFRSMASAGVRWHLYRITGTDQMALMREDASWDIPVPPIAVSDVHSMTEARLVQCVHDVLRAA